MIRQRPVKMTIEASRVRNSLQSYTIRTPGHTRNEREILASSTGVSTKNNRVNSNENCSKVSSNLNRNDSKVCAKYDGGYTRAHPVDPKMSISKIERSSHEVGNLEPRKVPPNNTDSTRKSRQTNKEQIKDADIIDMLAKEQSRDSISMQMRSEIKEKEENVNKKDFKTLLCQQDRFFGRKVYFDQEGLHLKFP